MIAKEPNLELALDKLRDYIDIIEERGNYRLISDMFHMLSWQLYDTSISFNRVSSNIRYKMASVLIEVTDNYKEHDVIEKERKVLAEILKNYNH